MRWVPGTEPLRPQFSADRPKPFSAMGTAHASETGSSLSNTVKCIHTPTRRPAAMAGIHWLLNLQNADGGLPTFCRGWTNLPFDRSAPDLTAHALRAWNT